MGAGFELTVLLQHRGGVGFLLHLKFPLQDLRFKTLAIAKINASENRGDLSTKPKDSQEYLTRIYNPKLYL